VQVEPTQHFAVAQAKQQALSPVPEVSSAVLITTLLNLRHIRTHLPQLQSSGEDLTQATIERLQVN
jgi:hypothetical protein